MAVVHLGRALSSLIRSGLGESSPQYTKAIRLVAEASDALLDAIESGEPED
jgi:hypothetical protein